MFNVDQAAIYDIESYPNVFTCCIQFMHTDEMWMFEISEFQDDRQELMQCFNYLQQSQTPMIGFNSINYDYPVIHHIFHNPNVTAEDIYSKSMSIINSLNRFGHMIWADKRFAPQIDVFKINHFDNKAKSTSLKALQINMRSRTVVDTPIPFGTVLTKEQVENDIKPYNIHDVAETKQFVKYNKQALDFRISLINQFGIDVLNWSDTKIGSRMMEDKIGKELCYDWSSGKKKTNQTPRSSIALNDVIFPYIQFQNPEFNRILSYLRQQVLTTKELDEFVEGEPASIETKGVFKGLHANVGNIDFHFGTGGIHGSVSSQKIFATQNRLLRDIDVAQMYPEIAIQNGLAPEHLGEVFTRKYAELPQERKRWQAEKGKKCVEANSLKLASNSVYGNSNNKYSPFYDPKFTMTITINGQLMLCMLAEQLLTVPTLELVQINTDGITYTIDAPYEPQAAQVCREWEVLTALVLEDADYSRMWIRDVNNYIAEDIDGELKMKGAYWFPDPANHFHSISQAQPPAWHKNLSNIVSVKAAAAAMIHGVDPEQFIRLSTDPHDFICRIKVPKSNTLRLGDQEIQGTSRYYVSVCGHEMTKEMPPLGKIGAYSKAQKVSQEEYDRVMLETGGEWDERVNTKNKSKYGRRIGKIQAGYQVSLCNDITDFDYSNIDYTWYVNEAKKLII